MQMDRLDRRQRYLETVTGPVAQQLRDAGKVSDYMKGHGRRAVEMDSPPVKKAFDFLKEEKPETSRPNDVATASGTAACSRGG
jgi:hypothetical protein